MRLVNRRSTIAAALVTITLAGVVSLESPAHAYVCTSHEKPNAQYDFVLGNAKQLHTITTAAHHAVGAAVEWDDTNLSPPFGDDTWSWGLNIISANNYDWLYDYHRNAASGFAYFIVDVCD